MQGIFGSTSKVPDCYTKLKVWQRGILHIERVAHPWRLLRWLSSSLIFEQALLTGGANSHPSWVICFIYSTRDVKNTKFRPRLPGGCLWKTCVVSVFQHLHVCTRHKPCPQTRPQPADFAVQHRAGPWGSLRWPRPPVAPWDIPLRAATPQNPAVSPNLAFGAAADVPEGDASLPASPMLQGEVIGWIRRAWESALGKHHFWFYYDVEIAAKSSCHTHPEDFS